MNNHLYNEIDLVLLKSNHDTNEDIRLYGNGDTTDFQPVVKWVDLLGTGSTWLITEVDPDECLAFGLCDLGMGFPEMGSVSIDEINGVKFGANQRIVKADDWKASQSLTHYANDARVAGCIVGEPESPAYDLPPRMRLKPILDMDRVIEVARATMFGMANTGFCLECGEEQEGCEPDAENRECESCGAMAVMGAEQCLLSL
jgi:hypothetical protein